MIVARCPTSRRYQHQLLTSVPECKVNRLRLKPGKVLVHLLWFSLFPEDECKLQSQKALQHKISPSFFEHPIILTYHSYKGWVDTFDTRTKSAKKVNLTLCGRTRWSKKQFTKCLYPSHRQYPSSLMVVTGHIWFRNVRFSSCWCFDVWGAKLSVFTLIVQNCPGVKLVPVSNCPFTLLVSN